MGSSCTPLVSLLKCLLLYVMITGIQLYLRQSMGTSGVVYLLLFVYSKWQQCTEVFVSYKNIVAVHFLTYCDSE